MVVSAVTLAAHQHEAIAAAQPCNDIVDSTTCTHARSWQCVRGSALCLQAAAACAERDKCGSLHAMRTAVLQAQAQVATHTSTSFSGRGFLLQAPRLLSWALCRAASHSLTDLLLTQCGCRQGSLLCCCCCCCGNALTPITAWPTMALRHPPISSRSSAGGDLEPWCGCGTGCDGPSPISFRTTHDVRSILSHMSHIY
jgi:hypothetical protein